MLPNSWSILYFIIKGKITMKLLFSLMFPTHRLLPHILLTFSRRTNISMRIPLEKCIFRVNDGRHYQIRNALCNLKYTTYKCVSVGNPVLRIRESIYSGWGLVFPIPSGRMRCLKLFIISFNAVRYDLPSSYITPTSKRNPPHEK